MAVFISSPNTLPLMISKSSGGVLSDKVNNATIIFGMTILIAEVMD
jgi:hypothetical protein